MLKSVLISYASTGLLALAVMLFSSAAQAMEIWKFDNLAFQDQGDYI